MTLIYSEINFKFNLNMQQSILIKAFAKIQQNRTYESLKSNH